MRKIIFAFLGLFIIIQLGCKKKEKDPTSIWTVNGHEYSTNEYQVDQGKAVLYFRSKDFFTNAFSFVFHEGYFPETNFPLACGDNDPIYQCLSITWDSVVYYPNSKRPIIRTTVEGSRSVYNIDSMWFINAVNANDSVLVRATFKQP